MTTETASTSALALCAGALDRFLDAAGRLFLIIANICLAIMLLATAVTIILRPFGISFFWIWPWTMILFVWMTFFGFFAVYRLKKDIAVDFMVLKMGERAMQWSRYFVAIMTITVTGAILWQMPTIIELQVGPIDSAILPWDAELERYFLSWPLAISTALVMLESVLEILKAMNGVPEVRPSHVTDPEG